MKQKNYEKGITLIALVITIIVLLILAGVTLNLVINQGLLDKTSNATDTYKISEYKEKIEVIKTGEYLKKISDKLPNTLKNLVAEELRKQSWVTTVETKEDGLEELEENQIKVITKDNYIIIAEIEDDGKVTYITIEKDNGEPYPSLELEQLSLEGIQNEKAKIKVTAKVEKTKKTKKIERIELILDGKTIATRNYNNTSTVEDTFEVEKEGKYIVKVTTDQGKSTSKKISVLINTLTIKHYLENENDTNYTLSTTTTSVVEYGTSINLVDHKTEIENGTYSYGSLIESTSGGEETLATAMEPNKTICLYYSRNIYTLTLEKGSYISAVSVEPTSTDSKYKVGQSITINAVVEEPETGYENSWSGWTSSDTNLIADTTTQNATITMPAGDVTLTANGTRSAKSYIVTFNANGGTVSTTSKSVTYNSTYETLPTPEKTGYIFNGWYTATSGGTQVTTTTIVSITEDQTLYARWTIKTYTITYNANGGTGTVASQTKTYGVDLTLRTTVPTRTGYTFQGWATSSSSTTVSYSPGQTYSSNSSLNLYAVWYCSGKTGTISCGNTVEVEETCGGKGVVTERWTGTYATPTGGSYTVYYIKWKCDNCGYEGQLR